MSRSTGVPVGAEGAILLHRSWPGNHRSDACPAFQSPRQSIGTWNRQFPRSRAGSDWSPGGGAVSLERTRGDSELKGRLGEARSSCRVWEEGAQRLALRGPRGDPPKRGDAGLRSGTLIGIPRRTYPASGPYRGGGRSRRPVTVPCSRASAGRGEVRRGWPAWGHLTIPP